MSTALSSRGGNSGGGSSSSSSGGGFSDFFGSVLSNRGGNSGGGSSGGFGDFFNTRPVMENKSRGSFGLFSENSKGASSSNDNSDYHKYPVTRYGSESSYSPSAPTQAPSHGKIGWNI